MSGISVIYPTGLDKYLNTTYFVFPNYLWTWQVTNVNTNPHTKQSKFPQSINRIFILRQKCKIDKNSIKNLFP
jgi:hypothetical protein